MAPTKATSGSSTGIYSGESGSGGGEDANVFTVAVRAKGLLEKAGYTVVLSRTSNPDKQRKTLWQKGNAAEMANSGQPADIAVSVHTDVKANIGAGQIYYDMLSAQHVPWVYNEFGRTTSSGLSSRDLSVYVTSVVGGVERSIGPVSGGAIVQCTP